MEIILGSRGNYDVTTSNELDDSGLLLRNTKDNEYVDMFFINILLQPYNYILRRRLIGLIIMLPFTDISTSIAKAFFRRARQETLLITRL